jgi:hypothetical protein
MTAGLPFVQEDRMAKSGGNSPKAGRRRGNDDIAPRNMAHAFELLAALPDDAVADQRQDAPPQARGNGKSSYQKFKK